MDDIALKDALYEYVTDAEPPLGLTSTDVLAAGRRTRRLRTTGVGVAVAVVTAGALAIAPLVAGPAQPGGTTPAAACAGATPRTPVDADRQTRITCHLTQAIASRLPDTTLRSFLGPRGTKPLHAYPNRDDFRWSYRADAIVTDGTGTGTILFVIGPRGDSQPATPEECRSKGICEQRTGPHGEAIEVFTSRSEEGPDRGWIGYTIYVFTGQTLIIATSNNDDGDSNGDVAPTRSEPFLDADALIEITTAPELAVFS